MTSYKKSAQKTTPTKSSRTSTPKKTPPATGKNQYKQLLTNLGRGSIMSYFKKSTPTSETRKLFESPKQVEKPITIENTQEEEINVDDTEIYSKNESEIDTEASQEDITLSQKPMTEDEDAKMSDNEKEIPISPDAPKNSNFEDEYAPNTSEDEDDIFDTVLLPGLVHIEPTDDMLAAISRDKGIQLLRRMKEEHEALKLEKQRSAEIEARIQEHQKNKELDNYRFDEDDQESEQLNAMNSIVMGNKSNMTNFEDARKKQLAVTSFPIHPMSASNFVTKIKSATRTLTEKTFCSLEQRIEENEATKLFEQILSSYIGTDSEEVHVFVEARELVHKALYAGTANLTCKSLIDALAKMGVSEERDVTCDDALDDAQRTVVFKRTLPCVVEILATLVKQKGFCTDEELLHVLRLSVMLYCSEEVSSYSVQCYQSLLWTVAEELSVRTASNPTLLRSMTRSILTVLERGLRVVSLEGVQPVNFIVLQPSVYQFITCTMNMLQSHLPNTFKRVSRMTNVHMLAQLLGLDQLKFNVLGKISFPNMKIPVEELHPRYTSGLVRQLYCIIDTGVLENESEFIPQIISAIRGQINSASKKKTTHTTEVFGNLAVAHQTLDLFIKTFCVEHYEANHEWYDTIVEYRQNNKKESGAKKRSRDSEEISLLQFLQKRLDDLNVLIRDRKQFVQQSDAVMNLTMLIGEGRVYLKKTNDRRIREGQHQEKKQQKLITSSFINTSELREDDSDDEEEYY
jgi:hypothetical protein